MAKNIASADQGRLKGELGVIDIVFTVLAFNAPLTVVTNFAVFVILYGNGIGAPAAYAGAALVWCIFASCFTAMAKSVPNAGAYYAYVTAGLGQKAGLTAAVMAALSYSFMLLGMYLFAAYIWHHMMVELIGPNFFEWWYWAALLWLVVSIMGYLNINLSAKVLGAALVAEIVIVLLWQAVSVTNYGIIATYQTSWLTFETISSGSIVVAMLYALASFAGFEATAVFREESRNPDRTIPRATYLAVIIMMLTFGSSLIVYINLVGSQNAVAATQADIGGAVLSQINKVLGGSGVLIVELLLCTSTLACAIALHNVITRYAYSLAVDQVISPRLAKIHPKHGSPYLASIVISGLFAIGVFLEIVLGMQPLDAYAVFTGFGGLGLIYLVVATAFSIFVYFRKTQTEFGIFKRVIAPILVMTFLSSIAVYATIHIDLMTGSIVFGYVILLAVLAICFVTIFYAGWLKKYRPSAYISIGRQNI